MDCERAGLDRCPRTWHQCELMQRNEGHGPPGLEAYTLVVDGPRIDAPRSLAHICVSFACSKDVPNQLPVPGRVTIPLVNRWPLAKVSSTTSLHRARRQVVHGDRCNADRCQTAQERTRVLHNTMNVTGCCVVGRDTTACASSSPVGEEGRWIQS